MNPQLTLAESRRSGLAQVGPGVGVGAGAPRDRPRAAQCHDVGDVGVVPGPQLEARGCSGQVRGDPGRGGES